MLVEVAVAVAPVLRATGAVTKKKRWLAGRVSRLT
jgi:hypothetical protein